MIKSSTDSINELYITIVDKIPILYLIVFYLVIYGGLTYKQVGEIIGVSSETIRLYLENKVYKVIKQELNQELINGLIEEFPKMTLDEAINLIYPKRKDENGKTYKEDRSNWSLDQLIDEYINDSG